MPLLTANRFSYGASMYDTNGLTPLPYDKKSYDNMYNTVQPTRSTNDVSQPPDSVWPPANSQDLNGFVAPPPPHAINKWQQEDLYRNQPPPPPPQFQPPPLRYDNRRASFDVLQSNTPDFTNAYGYNRQSMPQLNHIPPPPQAQHFPPNPTKVNNYNEYPYGYPAIQPVPNNKKTSYPVEQKPKVLAYDDRMLAERYPNKFVIAHSIAMFILCATVIAIQIVMIIYTAPYYYVGSGIWVGVYFAVAAILALVIIKKPNYSLFIFTCLMYFIGILLVSVGGLIVVNSIALYSSLYCSTLPCSSVNAYNITMIILGGLINLAGLVYLLKMQCSLNNTARVNY